MAEFIDSDESRLNTIWAPPTATDAPDNYPDQTIYFSTSRKDLKYG